MKRCPLLEGIVIFFSIKLPNMVKMQETLTGSTFDQLFFFAIFNPFSGRFHIKNLTIFNFGENLDANSHPGENNCATFEKNR